jgi:soluble lytic murein transglycosylase
MGAFGKNADRDMLWLVAAMFDRAGAYVESTNLARRRLRSFTTRAPKGEARAMWRIAYPRAFYPLIETVGKQFGISASFIRAVAREESGFEPTAVSPAHAYGLIQLIAPTARRHARELGLPSDPASLKLPEINLPIGTNFIRYLWRRYASNPAIVPAAYNAGQGAADRWLKERPDQNLDAWIESIPYPETRRYTRRVLQTYGVYAWLDTGAFPALPARLPQP